MLEDSCFQGMPFSDVPSCWGHSSKGCPFQAFKLGLLSLFLFRLSNKGVQGISFSKRSHILKREYSWQRWGEISEQMPPQRLHEDGRQRTIFPPKFPRRTNSNLIRFFSGIARTINRIIFCSFWRETDLRPRDEISVYPNTENPSTLARGSKTKY